MFEPLCAADFDPPKPAVNGAMCESGKACYTKKQVRQKAARKTNAVGVQLYVYRCPRDDCEWWHMTSHPTQVRRGDPSTMGGHRSRR